MDEIIALQQAAAGYLAAAAIGFLVGRTRERPPEEAESKPPRPGIRDFVVVALLGATAARIGDAVLAVVLLAAIAGLFAAMRAQHPERGGITTELAALATYLLGYLCLGPHATLAAALGIVLAGVLAAKEPLHRFATQTLSASEFNDILKFLALIFVIYPLLPTGGYGPFDFFEPRKIWFFVILVSGVSFAGYFLNKFMGPGRGLVLGALVGGLASTTAYTGGAARAATEAPDSAVSLARATLLANSILFPRMALIVAAIDPGLASAAAPALAAMSAAGLLAALLLGRAGPRTDAPVAQVRNPFALWPALQFGAVFTAVLFLTRAAQHFYGGGGLLAGAALGGLIDVDAVLLSLASFHQNGAATTPTAVLGLVLAATANAAFKGALALASRQRAYFGRVLAGFALMFAAGFTALAWVG